ncbi:FAD-dependent monooxygenase [Amycolatopsis sp. NPDC058986]|uniref:FAD-dependent monooxygenase n=1 Tax=unclassified Amycolatopsis TaxID=2618356 RepID=UPI00366E46E3
MPENTVVPGNAEVVISGAGPNGLMLAAELALAGVRPIVLERLPEPSDEPKANGMVGQIVRFLDQRGLYEEISGRAGPPQPAPAFFFGGMTMSFAEVVDNPLHLLPVPQPKLVRLLDKRALDLGVEIRRSHELTGLVQDESGVTLTVSGPRGEYELRTRFLVGADGGKSLVRKQTGIAFPGVTDTKGVTRLAQVSLPGLQRTADGGIDIPGVGPLGFGFNRLERGTFVFAELQPGKTLIATGELRTGPIPDGTPLTLDELRDSVRRVLGVDLGFGPPEGPGPHPLRRITTQNTRQAENYRAGNVFLIGDAAHVHSGMGGPGLNLGMQDVANLGWKLAAYLRGHAPESLLDTYQSERHPVGERVMMHSLAQAALIAPGPEVTALRRLFGEMVRKQENSAFIAHLMAGSDVRYDIGDTHPLSGRMVPDLAVGSRRVTELLRTARPVLADFTGGTEIGAAAVGWADRVDLVSESTSDTPVAAVLVRPDGYVAWATDSPQETDGLQEALTRWFGAAA